MSLKKAPFPDVGHRNLTRKISSFFSRFFVCFVALCTGLLFLWSRYYLDNVPVEREVMQNFLGLSCPRIMKFRMGHLHGFASEISLYARIVSIAAVLNFTLVIDDRGWNYGSLKDYFVPSIQPASNCLHGRQAVWIDPKAKRERWPPKWVAEDYVEMPRAVDYIDQLFLALFVDRDTLAQMHHDDLQAKVTGPLDGNATLPELFGKAFKAQAEALKRLWVFQPKLAKQIWMGERALADLRAVQSTVIIGVHLRFGDKHLEQSRYQASRAVEMSASFQRTQRRSLPRSPSHVVEACFDAADSLLIQLRDSKTSTRAMPILVVMSDNPDAIALLQSNERAMNWQILNVSSATYTAFQRPRIPRSQAIQKPAKAHSKTFYHVHQMKGFHEAFFNHQALQTRIDLTRIFLMELTVIGRVSDGIIFTGSSNVSKLFGLLGGVSRLEQKSMRSLDVRWHPTARYTR